MPFLRVIRDKRGYETTYLMHWFRDGGRQQSRILYAFRSPGGVRVGRSPLEPDVQREIEARHPDIHFDWNTVLGNQQVIESAPAERRPRRRAAPPVESAAAPSAPVRPVAAAPAPAVTAPVARPPVPSVMEGDTPEERVAFLTRWHHEVVERVTQRGGDAERQAALLTLAGRLDPSGWTDADQVTTGLVDAAEALEQLSRALGRRRRRSRRGRRGAEGAGEGTDEPFEAGAADDAPADADAGESGSDGEGEPG